MSWYTYSLSKTDQENYKASHDLFSPMFLASGARQGTALWITCNDATGENIFYVQTPDGLDVKNSTFFKTFPLTPCSPPSMVGLSLLVGKA